MAKVAKCFVCEREFRPKFKRGAYTRHCSQACGYITRSKEMRRDWKERFWEKVEVGSPNDCWRWTAAKTTYGYGVFSMNGRRDLHGAHRISWLIEHGEWPKDCVLHRCDNPACVNPKHLFDGTKAENMQDKISKGRQPRGATSGPAKLLDQQIIEILKDGRSLKAIAADYGVGYHAIRDIKRGVTWKHITGL